MSMATQIRIRRKGRSRRFFVAAALAVSSLALPTAALAQTDPYTENEPEVLPTRLENEEPQGTSPEAAERTSDGTLPVTGAELTLFVVTGLAAIKTGATIVRRTKA
jgi:hypothetical protein